MDLLAAISITGNILQLFENGILLLAMASEISSSPDGRLKEDADAMIIVANIKASYEKANFPRYAAQMDSLADKSLNNLIDQCIGVANELAHIADECYKRPQNPENKGHFFRALGDAVRIHSKQSESGKLRKRLVNLRDQISAHLLVLVKEEQMKLGKTLQNLVESNEKWQQILDGSLGQIISYLNKVSSQTRSQSNEAEIIEKNLPELQELLTTEDFGSPFTHFLDKMKWLDDRKREKILKTLHFPQIKEREAAVTEAHNKTLDWIFNESHPTNFVKWLREETNSIYWISGKAGSGKSTLMRFLTNNSKTIQFLKNWAGRNGLITASHYFWSPGTSIQKSQEGLFRSLLHQILHQRRELIPVVCADRWDTLLNDALYPWSLTKLVEALKKLGGLDDVGWKICLFIDGLDEYSGDRTQLINVIRKIGNSDRIKICTSSRPWLEFSDAFGSHDHQWKLHLQEYTRGDIQQFIKDELQDNTDFAKLQEGDRVTASNIISEIVDRAQGVFLWVFLVVRSLLRGLCNADEISYLQRRLRELPDDLYEFFDRMLSSIESVYKENVAQLFLTMAYAKSTLPVLTFYFIEVGNTPRWKDPLPFLREWPNVNPEELKVLDKKKRQLTARCKDLIHITSNRDAPVIFADQVSFLHRTVFDFLRTADINNRLLELAGGTSFTPSKILLRAGIGQTRSLIHLRRLRYIKPYLQQWILGSLFYAHLIEVSDGVANIDLLDELEDSITEAYSLWSFSHAMEDLFDMPRTESFLELACRCDLALYVCQKYPDHTPKTLDRIAPSWKKLVQPQQDADYNFAIIEKETEWRLGRHFRLPPWQTGVSPLEMQQGEPDETEQAERQAQTATELRAGDENVAKTLQDNSVYSQEYYDPEHCAGKVVDRRGRFHKLKQLFRRR